MPKYASSSPPPLGGSHDLHAKIGAATGRSSDLQALPIKLDRLFYRPIFPALEKTRGNWLFDPAHRCGAVPDSHRIPLKRSLRNATSKRPTT
jgi:hypothetical protein